MTNVDDFLKHYGVKGMRWGQRKATRLADAKTRRDILKDKNWDQLKDRREKEDRLKRLLEDDLAPKRNAAKRYVSRIISENQGAILTGALTGASIAAGIAFMALKMQNNFDGISMSPIPLR